MDQFLDNTFSALADPTRRAMLAMLSKGDAPVSEIAKPFLNSMSLPAVTKHIKVLEKAGLITKDRQAQKRICSINSDALKNASEWIDQYQMLWEESFDRLDEYLKTVTAKPSKKTERNKNARGK